MGRILKTAMFMLGVCVWYVSLSYATPSTLIWAPSTDIQPYKKIHLGADYYAPRHDYNKNDAKNYTLQVYGPTFSLLSDNSEENLLGKAWAPLGKIMAETGFDYKKGLGPALDTYPWYFHFKLGVTEDAYFKNMPAFAIGAYDLGTKRNLTNNNVCYWRAAKTVNVGNLNLGRFSGGYFWGNGHLLLNNDGLRDNNGTMFAWERTMTEISDKLWLCVDYQGTDSAYGAMNYGVAWTFNPNVAAIVGYDVYNNKNLTPTVTFQVDINF
jgi:hypothetical protein